MASELTILDLLREIEKRDPVLSETLYKLLNKIEKVDEKVVIKEEFREAQKIINRILKTQEELIKIQNETRQVLKELAEAQARTEAKVKELAEAQARTEEAVKRHEDRLSRVEKILEELVITQKHIEERVTKVECAVEKLRLSIESLRADLSISLEELGGVLLPSYLKDRYNIKVEKLELEYLKLIDGREREFDLVGVGEREGRKVLIVGEVKTRVTPKELKNFVRIVRKVKRPDEVEEIVPILFSRRMAVKVAKEAQDCGVIPISGSSF